VSYVLPLRRCGTVAPDELTAYLRWLASAIEVIVVDGSPPPLFAAHHASWSPHVNHVRPAALSRAVNGKVAGVMTGVQLASHEAVVIADDDVRYDRGALEGVAQLLTEADLVRPQNYFDPLPWHARWDTARTLLNRALASDFPGTLGVRRSTLLAIGGYDADSLFENLELIRTIEAAGGTVANCRGLYVRRRPPTARQFMSQRVRQAYESFAQPARLMAELSLLPAAVGAVVSRRRRMLPVAATASVALAELGRRRNGGRHVFPASCSLLAPAWAAERAVCVWVGLWLRLRRGGVHYAGRTVKKAASSTRSLRAKQARAGLEKHPPDRATGRGFRSAHASWARKSVHHRTVNPQP
jgi:hypothetical protein